MWYFLDGDSAKNQSPCSHTDLKGSVVNITRRKGYLPQFHVEEGTRTYIYVVNKIYRSGKIYLTCKNRGTTSTSNTINCRSSACLYVAPEFSSTIFKVTTPHRVVENEYCALFI